MKEYHAERQEVEQQQRQDQLNENDDHDHDYLLPLFHAIQQFSLMASPTETVDGDVNDARRIFHGRGGCFVGSEHVTLDWYSPVWLLTSYNVELTPAELRTIQRHIEDKHRSMIDNDDDTTTTTSTNDHGINENVNLVYQHRDKKNASRTTVLSGDVPQDHVVTENGMKFIIRLLHHGQNQGIFLDIKNGRQFVKHNSNNKKVLNLFAYTCGFSIAALLGGATEVVNIDMAQGCLKIGQRNHQINGLQPQQQNDDRNTNDVGLARFLAHDIFKTWGKIKKLGPYHMIVVDPPTFQRNSFVAKKDYQKIVKRLPDLLYPDGLVVLCLNAPELDTAWLKGIVNEVAPDLTFVERLSNPESFPAKDEERALKVLIYKKLVQEG
jgi:23S rRNA (cytosine1962-C5)-methyltransferase